MLVGASACNNPAVVYRQFAAGNGKNITDIDIVVGFLEHSVVVYLTVSDTVV